MVGRRGGGVRKTYFKPFFEASEWGKQVEKAIGSQYTMAWIIHLCQSRLIGDATRCVRRERLISLYGAKTGACSPTNMPQGLLQRCVELSNNLIVFILKRSNCRLPLNIDTSVTALTNRI